jgi:hypothetical protein
VEYFGRGAEKKRFEVEVIDGRGRLLSLVNVAKSIRKLEIGNWDRFCYLVKLGS